jgi:hypothetical protein
MADHPNADLVRKGYAAFGSGDMEGLRDLLAEDVVWHVAGNNALAGDYKGLDATLELFGRFFELSGGNMTQEIHDVVANDEHALAMIKQRIGRPDGRSYEGNEVHVFHVRDGKAVEFWAFAGDQAAVDPVLS